MTNKSSNKQNSTNSGNLLKSGKKFYIIIAVVVCLIGGIATWYYNSHLSDSQTLGSNDSEQTQNINITENNTPKNNQTSNGKAKTPNTNTEGIEKVEKLVIAGPMASISNPLIRLKNNNTLSDIAETIEFRQWRDPNQMRAMVLQDDVDFIAIPTNAAANLYNKGVDLKLINVSVWGILYIISNDEQLANLNQLKGKDLVMPFRGDMPDIVLQRLLQAQDIKPGQDINLIYVANPLAAMRMLITGKADHAVLVEPAVSMALTKTESLPSKLVTPTLYRSINLQKEWGKSFNSKPRMPQAGIAVVNSDLSKAQINRFLTEYSNALDWVNQNPKEASVIIAKDIPMLNEAAIEKSIISTSMVAVPADKAKPELISFYNQLSMLDSKLIGDKLPDDDFYYKP